MPRVGEREPPGRHDALTARPVVYRLPARRGINRRKQAMLTTPVDARHESRVRGFLRAHLAIMVILIGALIVRLVYIYSPLHRFDSDSSVVYLMALNVADGEFPAFFWGQSYGGSLLPLTAGAVMLFTGASVEVLSVVASLYFLGAAVCLYVACRTAIGARGAVVAATIFLFAGETVVRVSVIEPGFYGPSLLLGLASIGLVVRAGRQGRLVMWAAVGTLAGLAIWTSPMSVAFVAPAGLLLAIRSFFWRGLAIATVCALVAGLPWISATSASAFDSVRPLGQQVHPENLVVAITTMLPSALPLGSIFAVQLATALTILLSAAYLAVLTIRDKSPLAFLVLTSTLLVHVVLSFGSGTVLASDSVRYSVFYLPLVAVATAFWIQPWRVAGWIAGAAAVVMTLAHMGWAVSTAGSTPQRFDPGYEAVVEFLDAEGIDAAYGSYWLAYSLTASVDERVTIAALVPRRYEPYEQAAESENRTAVVVYSGNRNDELLSSYPGLPSSMRTQFGGYAVHVFNERIDPYELPLELF